MGLGHTSWELLFLPFLQGSVTSLRPWGMPPVSAAADAVFKVWARAVDLEPPLYLTPRSLPRKEWGLIDSKGKNGRWEKGHTLELPSKWHCPRPC